MNGLRRMTVARAALACALVGWPAVGLLPAQEEAGISVTEHGVGTGIEKRELQGRGDTFAEGTTVWFWTRVVGGKAGDRIQHVWLREGQEVVSVGLSIGGSHWRTYSRKILYPGSAGSWAVEARDAEGRVLAREEWTCRSAASADTETGS